MDRAVGACARMYLTRVDLTGFEDLQRRLMAVPAKYYIKNSRDPANKGQVHVGWTSMPGPQTQAVCGVQMPYLSSSYRYLAATKPGLLRDLQAVLDGVWARALRVFPLEAAAMMKTSACFRLGDTGFHKVSSGTNLAALWHTDDANLANSIQCVLVLGTFEGGEVRFDPAGRVGRNRSATTTSRGREDDVVVVPNEHGTLFIGHYESSVNAVTGGNRTIVAAYATNAVKNFDDAIRGRYSFEQADELRRHRVAAVKRIAAAYPRDKATRGRIRGHFTAEWRASDSSP